MRVCLCMYVYVYKMVNVSGLQTTANGGCVMAKCASMQMHIIYIFEPFHNSYIVCNRPVLVFLT